MFILWPAKLLNLQGGSLFPLPTAAAILHNTLVVISAWSSYRLLLSIDRRETIAEAWDTVQLAVEYSSASVASEHQCRVVGIDLSGDHGVC